MISELLDLLKKDEELFGWNVKVMNKKSYQLFFIRQQLDMNRETNIDSYVITIFKKIIVNKEEKMGSATFEVYASMSKKEIEEKLKIQKERCQYTINKAFHLAKKQDLKPVSKDVEFDGHSLKEAAFIAADALFEADKYDKGYINSSEIFIHYEEIRYFDSNNNIFLFCKAYGQIEFVVSWSDRNEEIELYKFIEFDKLDTQFIHNEANKMLVEASNRMKAQPTPEISHCKLMLTNEAARTFFCYFMNRCKTDFIYVKLSDVNIGTNLQPNAGKADKISIRLEPIMKNSTKGLLFDKDGIVLKKLVLIDKGIVKGLWGSNATAQYLSTPVHGLYQNMVVNTGTMNSNELSNETYLEVVSFSDFDVDLVTGDFGSEIRLAYLYNKNKGERQIVSGGSVSGNINDMLSSMRFSNESVQLNYYLGPKFVLLDHVKFLKAKKG